MPDSDFISPLTIAAEYHQAFETACDTLEQLCSTYKNRSPNAQAFDILKKHHHLFNRDLFLHFSDEEKDLFPRLLRTSLKMADNIHRLKLQQQQLRQQTETLRMKWQYPEQIDDWESFCHQLSGLSKDLIEHFRDKQENFYVMAEHLLSQQDLQAISATMTERRQQQ